MKGQMEWHDMIVVFTEQERVRSTLVYPFFSFAWPTHFVQVCTCESVWHCHLPAKGKCRGKSWLLIAMSSNSAPQTCSIDSSCCEFPLAHPFRKKAFCLAFMQPLSTELSKNTCLIWRHLVLYTYISGPIALDTVPFMAEYGRIKRPTGWSFWVKPMVPPCPRNFNRWDSWWNAIGLASRVPLRCPSLGDHDEPSWLWCTGFQGWTESDLCSESRCLELWLQSDQRWMTLFGFVQGFCRSTARGHWANKTLPET